MEIDLVLIKDREEVKTFAITTIAGDTAILKVYKTIDVDLPGVIAGGNITFTFDSSVNSELGVFEYDIIISHTVGPDTFPQRGNITYLTAEDFTTQIPTLIKAESLGINVDSSFETQSIMYWKYYLQPQFNILDTDVLLDSTWPILVRFLIAKLVVHDYIVGLMKGSVAASFGSTSETGETTITPGSLKKLETGPANAEWYNGNESLTKLLQIGGSGKSAFDQLRIDICQLAHRVRALIPMCGPLNTTTIIPIKGAAPCSPNLNDLLTKYYSE